MKKNHDIETYYKLAEGAKFFLDESFHYINEALSDEFASIIFSEKINSVEPSEDDRKIIADSNIPEDTIELLQAEDLDILTEETLNSMSDAWEQAQFLSKTRNHKFGIKHEINSIELLGHFNNFGFFIETLINRHLLYLRQSDFIDDFSYARISTAKVLERLIFIFKEGLNENKVHLNEIANLFSLRNRTVHYTPDNAKALKPKISEMIQIWAQSKKIIERFEKVENFNEDLFSDQLNNHISSFKSKWT
ncbi:MAG: hypothetical protein GY795_50565 [Desulfobacterales bacterium]|nr:hypothetical protein [Desulfobacterales bacterium]